MIVTKRELDDKDRKIIKLVMRKTSYRKISAIVFLSEAGIKRRVKQMKDYYNCGSTSDLISHLIDNGLL